MSEPTPNREQLPGLELSASQAVTNATEEAPGKPRVRPVDRTQLSWQMLDVERLIEADHPARAIWELVGRVKLDGFYAPIEAVEGSAGRTPWDPRLLVSLWIYAYSRGISSAREIARRCTYEPAFQWLCGLGEINHHTLSDFRVNHDASLGELFVQVLGVLSSEGLVSLERVMHDGTKIKACAGADSFRREERLKEHLEAARKQVEAMGDPREEEPKRKRAARERALRERQQRLEQALEEVQKVRESKRQDKEQARASQSDPQSRIMKQSDGGYAPSYNVQLSTEASQRIIVSAAVSQSPTDTHQLIGAVAQIEQNLSRSVICGRDMDDELRQKFAPRRNKRYAHLRNFDDEASWAKTLDWHNEYDFYRLTRSITARLDSDFREKAGLRVDQLAMAEEVEKMFRTCRDLYQEDPVFQARGIYVFLHVTMRLWLNGKAGGALETRRQTGERMDA